MNWISHIARQIPYHVSVGNHVCEDIHKYISIYLYRFIYWDIHTGIFYVDIYVDIQLPITSSGYSVVACVFHDIQVDITV